MYVIEAGGQRIDEIGARQGVFGITAVDCVPSKDGLNAEIFHVMAAVPTIAVNATHPGDADAHADRKVLSCALDDLADDLVAGDETWVECGEIALDDVQVGAAGSTGDDAEQDVAGYELRTRYLLNAEKG